jgi:mannose-1-phosphate guanylyltransferase
MDNTDTPVRTPPVHIVIMAGGRGTRFWPRSRARTPKQFLNIVGDDTMLRQTYHRIRPLAAPEAVWVVTNADYRDTVARQLPDLPADHILAEPAVRSTAPCIGLAALHIRRQAGDPIMAVLPADHYIPDPAVFLRCLARAIETAGQTGGLVTIGIQPVSPETCYGYIEIGDRVQEGIHRVTAFREKPDLATAERFLAGGNHLWNSGMFIWRTATILGSLARYCPEIYGGLTDFEAHLGNTDAWAHLTRIYDAFPTLSIDYAVMERADQVYVLKGDFGWSDVGSWSAVQPFWGKDPQGNALRGSVVAVGSRDSIVAGDQRLIALVGVENLIVIDTPDALLVCRKDRDQDIKKVIEILQQQRLEEYL